MLGESPVGNRVSEVFRIADGTGDLDAQLRMLLANVVEQPGQILFQVPALGEEQGNYCDAAYACGGQPGYGASKGRLHELQKREFHRNAGLLRRKPRRDPAKWLGP